MKKGSKIYLAGHTGLVGSAITSALLGRGYTNLLLRDIEELDLTRQKDVEEFFASEKPEYVIIAAAKVGGIVANNTLRADFIYVNLLIQSNVIYASWKYGVKKLLFLGSTCIYPKNAPQPLREEYLLTSELEYTNEPYAIAKIAGIKMCESFNKQYNTNFISVMPTNLYGFGDNYDLEKSHVLPALLRKFHLGKCLEDNNWSGVRADLNKNPIGDINGEASEEDILAALPGHGISVVKQNGQRKVIVSLWGSGKPQREFMNSKDMAAASVYIMENIDIGDITGMFVNMRSIPEDKAPHFINIGTGSEISIKELALAIKKLTGFKGDIVFDSSKPDGTMRKITDPELLVSLGFRYQYDLLRGLADTYKDYKSW